MNLLIQKMMKNNLLVWFGAVALCIALSGCEKKETEQPEQPGTNTPIGNEIPASFPKKHLIEEFTGQDCGYCPSGMDAISQFVNGSGNWVTVLHHYGFKPDHFSVAGSNKIMTQLNVDGAPSVSVDRQNVNYTVGNGYIYHPTYLNKMDATQFASTTYASVIITNKYNASTRQLDVTVTGALCRAYSQNLMLTVLVKESGMIDYQQDYDNTFEGWEQFRHANAVRVFLSNEKGDTVLVDGTRHYKATYSTTLRGEWKTENCMVVAFLSEGFSPVVQTEEQPVVAGTKGGSDLVHCGIKAVEVPDYYPEPDAVTGASTFTGNSVETMTVSEASCISRGNGISVWDLRAYNAATIVDVRNKQCMPYVYLLVITSDKAATIPAGTYAINSSFTTGSVYAGYRDDSKQTVEGSRFFFIDYSRFQDGRISYYNEWMVAVGEMTIASDGTWTLNAHTLNGSSLRLKGVKAIQY